MLSNWLWGLFVVVFFIFMTWLDNRKQKYKKSIHSLDRHNQKNQVEDGFGEEKSQGFPPHGMGGSGL